jgi:hypothetical protein
MFNHQQLEIVVGRDVTEEDGKRIVDAMTRTLAGDEVEAFRFADAFYSLIQPGASIMEIIAAAKDLGIRSNISIDKASKLTGKVNDPRSLRCLVGPDSSSRALMILAAFVSGIYSASSSLLNSWKSTRLLMRSGKFAREWKPVTYIPIHKPVEWELVDDPVQELARRRQISEFGWSGLQVAKTWRLKRR